LRPIEQVDRAARFLFEPARLFARLALPLGSSVAAGEESEARARVREMLLAEQEEARPKDPSLVSGRGLVHAQVVDRLQEKADLVVVRFPIEAALEPGMPVVCGEVYVGTVFEVGRALPQGAAQRPAQALVPGEARVQLVTSAAARVGARAGAVEVVAGGLARTEQAHVRTRRLALRAQQADPGPERELRVHEDQKAAGEWATLAEGYRLGTLVAHQVGLREVWDIEPLLDYRGGFAQVFVLCPPERAPAGALLAQDPFEARAWRPVRAALDGTLSSWRETRRLLSGTRAGMREGAAVARGTEFVGRIARADYLSCDVECLGDPGFGLLALASIPGRKAPLHLGRVTSLGTDASRALVYLEWEQSQEFAAALGAGATAAELYTSAGERGIPPGLHLGSAQLVAGAGERVLVLRRAGSGSWGNALEAWIGERAEEQGP
jgi:hypothetical protein